MPGGRTLGRRMPGRPREPFQRGRATASRKSPCYTVCHRYWLGKGDLTLLAIVKIGLGSSRISQASFQARSTFNAGRCGPPETIRRLDRARGTLGFGLFRTFNFLFSFGLFYLVIVRLPFNACSQIGRTEGLWWRSKSTGW